jgi:hypothetical protein
MRTHINMPYVSEKNDDSTADFTRQLSIVENLIDSNTNRHIIASDDSNVDFSIHRGCQ